MLLPTNILVLSMSLPLLIVSSPQQLTVRGGISACFRFFPCNADNYCNGEQCVPCAAAGCGIGAVCTAVDIGSIFCECPANTQGDAMVQCHPVIDEIVGNRQSSTQVGNKGDGNQVNKQVGGAQGVKQDDGIQVNNHGGDTGVVNQGVGTQVDSGIQASSGAQNGSNNQVSGTPSGSNALVDSGMQVNNQGGSTLGGCRINSQCRSDESCQSGSCIDPCVSVKCGEGAICQVSHRQGQCVCPKNRQGNPRVQCHPIPECALHSNCRDNKICQSGSCVDPCALIQCGKGAVCMVSKRRGQCVCDDNTLVNPGVQCNPKPVKDKEWCELADADACTSRIAVKDCPQKCSQKNPMNDATQPSTQSSITVSNQKNPMNDATQPSTPSSITASNQSDVAFPEHVSENEQGTRDPGCENAPDPGECRGAFKRFYYNKQNDQCDCFLFGGCDEEKIKFTWLTFEECQRTCVPGNKTQGEGCKRVTLEEVQSFLEEERRNRENSKN